MSIKVNDYLNKALDFYKKNNLKDSKYFFNKALALDPMNFQALHSMGVISGIEKNHLKAKSFFLECINLNPNSFSAKFNLANSILELRQFDKALVLYEELIKLNPNHPQSWCFKGIALKELNRFDESILSFEKSIMLDAMFEIPHFHLGSIFRELKLYEKSIQVYEKALKIFTKKEILEVLYTNLSGTKLDKKNNQFEEDYSEVREASIKALSYNSKNYLALNNLAMSYLFELKHFEAADLLKKVIEIKPDFVNAHKNLGSLYSHLGDYHKSEKYLKSALAIDTTDKSRNLLLSEALLFQNKFSEAWFYYEDRWLDQGALDKAKPNFTKPVWSPEMGFDCKILVWAEQGLGDMVLFSNILPDLVSKFTKVYLTIDGRLCKVIQESIPGINTINFSNSISEDFFDYQLSLCSLGQYFRNDIDNFFKSEPLFKVIKNINIPPKKKKYRCAISWKSKGGLKSSKKNISFNFLTKLLNLNHIEFFDIQYTDEDDESNKYNLQSQIKFQKPKGLDIFNDIYGLLQFMDSCDFIISTSNTNAHLAGALGKPLYLLLPKEYGRLWYWDNDFNGRNLWYPSIKKFSQSEQGCWEDPTDKLLSDIIRNYN